MEEYRMPFSSTPFPSYINRGMMYGSSRARYEPSRYYTRAPDPVKGNYAKKEDKK